MEPVEQVRLWWRLLHLNARLLLLLGIPVAMLLTVLVCLHLALNSNMAQDLIEGLLEDLFAGEVIIDDLRIGVDPRKIDIYGVTLLHEDGRELLYAESLAVRVSAMSTIRSLIDGGINVTIAQIDLHNGRTLAEFDDRGGFIYTDFFAPPPGRESPPDDEPSPLAIYIRNVNIHNLNATLKFPEFEFVYYKSSISNFEMTLEEGKLTMKADALVIPEAESSFKPDMFGFSPEDKPPTECEDAKEAKAPMTFPMRDLKIEGWDWYGDGFTLATASFTSKGATYTVEDGEMDFRQKPGLLYRAKLSAELPPSYDAIEYFTGPLIDSPMEISMDAQGYLGPEMSDNSHIRVKMESELAGLKMLGLQFERSHLKAELVNRRRYFTEFEAVGYGGRLRLPESAAGPLPRWLQADIEPPKLAERGYLNLLNLNYHMPLIIEDLNVVELLLDFTRNSEAPLAPTDLLIANGALSATLDASGRLIDVSDSQRYTDLCGKTPPALPEYHRLKLDALTLNRDPDILGLPEAVVPSRRLGVSGQILYTEGRLEGETDLLVRLDEDLVEIEGLALDLEAEGQPIEARVSLSIGDLGRYMNQFGVEGFGGQTSMSFDINGPMLNPQITNGLLVIDDPTLAGFPGTSLTARFSLGDNFLNLKEVVARGRYGNVNVDGRIRLYDGELTRVLPDPRLELNFSANPVDLTAGLAVAREAGLTDLVMPIAGKLNVAGGQISGPVSRLAVGMDLETGPVVVDGQMIHGLAAGVDVDLAGGRLSVTDLDVWMRSDRGHLTGRVDWLFDGELDAALLLKELSFGDVNALRDAGLKGRIEHLDVSVVGPLNLDALTPTEDPARWFTLQKLDMAGGLVAKDLQVGAQHIGDAFGVWNTLRQTLMMRLSLMPYMPPEATFPLFDPDGAAVLDATLRFKRRHLSPLVAGAMMGAARHAGLAVIQAWAFRQADGHLHLLEPHPIEMIRKRAVAFQGGVGERKDRLPVRSVHPALLEVEVSVPQSIASDGDEAYAVARFDQLDVRGVLLGLLESDIMIERSARNVAAALEARIRTNAELIRHQRQVKAGARRTSPPEPYKPLPQSSSLEEGLGLLSELFLTGEVEVTLDRTDMSSNVYAILPEIRVKALERELRNTEDVIIGFNGQQLAIESLTLGRAVQGGQEVPELSVSGAVSLGQGEPFLDLALTGGLELGLFNLMPDVYTDLTGVAQVDLEFKGRLDDPPEASGTVQFSPARDQRVSLRLRSLGEDIVVKGGVIALCPSRAVDPNSDLANYCEQTGSATVKIPSSAPILADLLDGKVTMWGGVVLGSNGVRDVELDFNARNLSYRLPETANLTLHLGNGRLRLPDVADSSTWSVHADIDVIDGQVNTNLNVIQDQGLGRFRQAFGSGRTGRFEASVLEQMPFLNKIQLDGVSLRIRDGFEIRAEVDILRVELELKANLNFEGTVGAPTAAGVMTLLPGGQVTWQGSDFVVREGTVAWQGVLANPRLKLIAEVDIENKCVQLDGDGEDASLTADVTEFYQIVMDIEGEVAGDDLNPQFTSQPFVNEADIATLILTGCTADQLNTSAASSPGLALALDQVLGTVEDELQEYLQVEELDIFSDLDKTEVVLTERLNNRFRLRFSGVFSDGGAEQSFVGQYTLSDNSLLEIGESSNDTEVRLDAKLKYRITFK